MFSEYYVAPLAEIFKAPDHLTDAEAAALPLAGLTAYRAVFTKGQVAQDQNVLITGIGTVLFNQFFTPTEDIAIFYGM